jgi:Ca-activated chloride channel family protein
MKPYTKRAILFLLLIFLLLAACSGGADETQPIAVERPRDESNQAPITSYETSEDGDTEASTSETTVTEQIYEAVEVEAEDSLDAASEAAPSGYMEPLPPVATAAPDIVIVPRPAATPSAMFFEEYGVNPYILTEVDNLSTFSLDVDTGSYSIARRYLQDGLMPPPESVRVEEFVNSFDQGYQIPPNTAFAVYADGAPSPFHTDGTYFLRIGVQGYESSEEVRPSANLVFVIDVSGSMAQENRLELVKQSLEILVDRMRVDDTIAIVVYGSDARVVLPPTNGSDQRTIMRAINSLETEGSTNLEAGLLLGYQMANQAYKFDGINRVILASDGVANVGNTSADGIAAQIRGYADAGIQLTTIGFGLGNYNQLESQ